jgi:hypothetical protein
MSDKRKVSANRPGLLLGLALVIGGVALLILAPEGAVSHAAIRYVRTSIEHVSSATSRFYGGVLVLAGIGIMGYSLPRSRK